MWLRPSLKEYGLQDNRRPLLTLRVSLRLGPPIGASPTIRVGHFVLDNNKSNDTCVKELTAQLQLNRDPKRYRLRCFGHVLNVAVRAFISGKADLETAEEEPSFTTRARTGRARCR